MKKYNLFKRLTYPFDGDKNPNASENCTNFKSLVIGLSVIAVPLSLCIFPENFEQNLENLTQFQEDAITKKIPDEIYRIIGKGYTEIGGVPIERYFK